MAIVDDQEVQRMFEKIRPIVLNTQKVMKIHLWELDDYLQEAMILVYQMLEKGHDSAKFPIHFKVQYRHHLTDIIRRENAHKRFYDKQNYEDISDVAFKVADNSFSFEKELIYEETKSSFLSSLKLHEKRICMDLMNGKTVDRRQKYRLKQKFLRFLLELENREDD